MVFTCHSCGKEIMQKELVAATTYLRVRTYHRTCFADILKERVFMRNPVVVNSPQGRLHYWGAYAMLVIVGILCAILAVNAAYTGSIFLIIFYGLFGAVYASASIYYIRTYRKYIAILGPQPLPEELQKTRQRPAKAAPLPAGAIVCAHCQQQVTTRADLMVAYSGNMPRSGIYPFHRACFVTKSQASLWTTDVPLNNPTYMWSAVLLSIVFLIMLGGVLQGETHPLLLLLVLAAGFFTVGPRWYAYSKYERKLH